MAHPYDVLELNHGAKFIFTACPGTKEKSVAASIETLKSTGASTLISLLPDSEIEKLQVTELGSETTKQGLTWYQLPIEDDKAPQQAFFDAFEKSKKTLLNDLATGKTFVIHCRGGSGRTGLMAAILLLESGYSWEQTKSLIQDIRPKALTIPDHLEFLQKHYAI